MITLVRKWTEAQQAETLDAEKAIAFSENLRRQSRWGEIDHHLLDMLKRELQEKYFVACRAGSGATTALRLLCGSEL